jgi:hypothetical protein
MNDEHWLSIAGWDGLYEVSNHGHIKSLERKITAGSRTYVIHERILSPRRDKDGYMMVDLQNAGKVITHKVHRIVAMTFLQNPCNKPQVNHKDGNRANNTVQNLEWVTDSENKIHSHTKLQTSRGKSGLYGVNWRSDRGKWRAYTTLGGYRHIGLFNDKEEARKAAEKARCLL